MLANWVGGGGVGYVPCFRHFNVCYVGIGGGVGGASGEESIRSC